jgi:hypothetical protein
VGVLLIIVTVVFVAAWVARYVVAQMASPAAAKIDFTENAKTPESRARLIARLYAGVLIADGFPTPNDIRDTADVFDVRLKPGQLVVPAMRDDLDRMVEELRAVARQPGGAERVLGAQCQAARKSLDSKDLEKVVEGLFRVAAVLGPLPAQRRTSIWRIAEQLGVDEAGRARAEEMAKGALS